MNKIVKNIIRKIWDIVPLSNTIVFESINDLDGNSGALFNYMLQKKMNEKYKMIWLIKNKDSIKDVKIKNVKFYEIYNYTILQKLNIGNAKFIFYDNQPIEKYRDKQKEIYLTHGFPGIKDTRSLLSTKGYADYVLCTSENMIQQSKDLFSTTDEKIFINDHPRNDDLYKKGNELEKIVDKDKYKKVIIWMPTFRKFYKDDRNDSKKEFNLGIPLIENEQQLMNLNNKLNERETLLIIKIHPGQDLSILKLKNYSNIKILLPNDLKKLNINLYQLLAQTDALVTDYSSVYFDYLLLDKPIAFVLDDIKDFKVKFLYDNVLEWMAGEKIYTYDEFELFIDKVYEGIDKYKSERKNIRDITHKYQDGNNCERIVDKFFKKEKILDGRKKR